jgi:peptide chain release factor 1
MDISITFDKMEAELADLERQLSDPAVITDQNLFRDLSRRHSELIPAIELYHEYQRALGDVEGAQELLAEGDDQEVHQMLEEAQASAEALHHRLLLELLPKDPKDDKGTILEIRAGTGGDEAGIFAGDLFTMYRRLAERRGWRIDVMSENPSEMGGYKEIVFAVEGRGAYGVLKHEFGVHRVQRVPKTEQQGRIHTSAATVAVLPEAQEVDIQIQPQDLQIEAFRAGGPGGQHMQKNETAVRITHLPTKVSVACSDQRSQQQNRERAMRILMARLYELELQRQQAEEAAARREQVRSGDRSEKIRTYNFPQDRLTDHRVGLTLHNLPALMDGELEELISALLEHHNAERLAALTR